MGIAPQNDLGSPASANGQKASGGFWERLSAREVEGKGFHRRLIFSSLCLGTFAVAARETEENISKTQCHSGPRAAPMPRSRF